MYIIHDFAKLHHISHIIWDVDGTITDESGEVNQEVAAKIISLGLEGIYHSFITGRDAQWIIEKVITPMERFYNFTRIRDNLTFFAEVGCVLVERDETGKIVTKIHPALVDNPLVKNESEIRDKIKILTYNPDNVKEYDPKSPIPDSHKLIFDANKVGWLVDCSKEAPPCYPYIWSPYKKAFATLEIIRDEKANVIKPIDGQTPYVETIKKTIKEAGFEDSIDIEEVSTAINIVPRVKGYKFGKAWSAGRALEYIRTDKLGGTFVLEEIIGKTIAFGDGRSDLEFTEPIFSPGIREPAEKKTLLIVFVGGEKDLPPEGSSDAKLIKNIVIKATGGGDLIFQKAKNIIILQAAEGARVTSSVLDFLKLWNYFRHF